jgi:cytoplasmic iron level regulating protein YaaA (DUF328/UPF0246 family)
LPVEEQKNLYEFWKKKVTNALNKEKTSCLSIWQAMNISAVDTKEFLAVVTLILRIIKMEN